MSDVADLYVKLSANTAGFKAAMAGAAADGEAFGARVQRGMKGIAGFGVLATAGIIAVGVKSIDMAANFQRSMEQIHTLAGVSQNKIAGLSSSVLALAGQVGYGPTSLAEALYHIESNFASMGMGGAKALDALRVAAEGAQIGNANLVDVTNALGAAVASGIGGVQDYSKAMGSLLAIVGSGDMQMQDLANAFSTGILAISKQYGATLNDVGAALATFGDNNIRGQVAATDLRMAIMDLTKQGTPGVKALEKIGVAAGSLGRDMQTGGMNKAIIDLRNHLNAAGITGVKVGRFLEDAFTKKSSAPLAILMGQFDRLESKYPLIAKGADGFAQAWKDASAGFQIALRKVTSGVEAFVTSIGTKLLPIATKALGGISSAFAWLGQHQTTLRTIGAMFAGVIATGLAMAAAAAWSFVSPFLMIAAPIAVVAGAIYLLWAKCKPFHDIVLAIGQALKESLGAAMQWLSNSALPALASAWHSVWDAIGAVIKWFVDGPLAYIKAQIAIFTQFWNAHGQSVMAIIKFVWTWIATIIKVQWAIIFAVLKVGLALFQAVWKLAWDYVVNVLKLVWNTVAAVVHVAIQNVLNIIALFSDLLTGKWSKLWGDVKKLVGDAIEGVWKVISTFASGAINLLVQAGKDLIMGLIHGIGSMGSAALGAVKGIGHSIVSGFTGMLGIHSPSTVFHGFGVNVGQGFVNGMVSMHTAVTDAAADLAEKATRPARHHAARHLHHASHTRRHHPQHRSPHHSGHHTSHHHVTTVGSAPGVFTGGTFGGSAPSGAYYVQNNYSYRFDFNGAVLDSAKLFTAMQQAALRYSGRNGRNGLVLG